ncbi:MAG: DUF935 family protein [Taibaiella sp.]|nr:DUF935 family protein [Taibaiella sp.]
MPDTNDTNNGLVNATQDQEKPINGMKAQPVLTNVQVRAVDRSPKSIDTWRDGIRNGESPYTPNHTRLFDIYTDILLDAHLAGITDKRIDTVLNKEVYFEKDGKNGFARDEDFDILIQSDAFRRLLRNIMLTQFWGRTGMQFTVGKEFDWKEIPRKHIKMKTQIISFEQNDLYNGVDYTDLWNVWILGKSDDLGLLASVAQYALLKRGAQGDWANYIEVFGQPAWVFKYHAYDQQTKAALDNIVKNIGNQLQIVVPKEADADPVDGKTSNGNGELQEKFYQAMNAEMSVRILGNTETTTNSKTGTGAKSKTHMEQQLEITKSDIAYVRNQLNCAQFLQILASYGYNVEGGRFAFGREADITFMTEKWIIDMGLIQSGLPVGLKYLYETYSIPAPEDGEDLLQVISQQITPNPDDPEATPKPGKVENQPKTGKPANAMSKKQLAAALLSSFFGAARK